MLRNMATIFLFNNEQLLMMKRSDKKLFHPNIWSVVGGHIESNEHNNPLETALRELEEETGFVQSDLQEINLRYILVRKVEDEIRTQYVFVAKTSKYDFRDSTEGQLQWVFKNDILKKDMTITICNSLKHYLMNEQSSEIFMGVFDKKSDVLWSTI